MVLITCAIPLDIDFYFTERIYLRFLQDCENRSLLTSLLIERSRVLEKLTFSQLVKKFPAFYGTQSSLTHLQMPASCPYPEPDQHSPCRFILFLEDPFEYYPPSTPGSSKWFLYLTFPHHKPVYTSPLPHTCYM